MKSIPLTQGYVTWVDDDVYEWASKCKWYARQVNHKRRDYCYAARKKHGETIFLHRAILGLKKGDSKEGDHVNHDTLDNRKSNLRILNRMQQQANRRQTNISKKGASRYKGVRRSRNKWRAEITGKGIHIGCYEDEKDAARAYDKAAVEMYGEFALTNQEIFPEDF